LDWEGLPEGDTTTMKSTSLAIIAGPAALLIGCTVQMDGEEYEPSPGEGDTTTEIGTVRSELVTTTLTYKANDQFFVELSTCGTTKSILLKEPDGPGPYPVFLYTGGTSEPYNSAANTAIVTAAANMGFVAAAVDYQSNTLPKFCGADTGWYKARCAYSTSHNSQSAIGAVCARSKAGCSTQGVVVAGFSQGAALAALARNFDTRVRGAWTMGFANRHWDGSLQSCFNFGAGAMGTNTARLLANNRMRIIRGGNEGIAVAWVNEPTGMTCAAGTTNCLLGANSSGWYYAPVSEVNGTLNPDKHCFMQNNPLDWLGQKVDCTNTHTVDPVFAALPPAATPQSGMYQNLQWLKNTVLPLGNQP
jgi:hypothetical protein